MFRTRPRERRPAELLVNATPFRFVAAIVLALGASGVVAQPAAEPTTARLIVKLRDGAGMQPQAEAALTPAQLTRLQAAAASEGVSLTPLRPMTQGAQVMLLDRRLTLSSAQALAARLAQSPDVEYIEPDLRRHAARTPNDSRFPRQWYLSNNALSIYAMGAWDVTTGSPSVVVAVVDSGYRPHEDLAGRLLPGYDFITDPKVANDGDGRDADATDPGDWVDTFDQSDPDFKDCDAQSSDWHGTGVLGLIGANSNNSVWVAGIDWAAKLLPVRVLGKCGGYDSDIIDGVAWAAGLSVPGVPANPHPANVINMSLGGAGDCLPAYHSVFSAALAHGVTRAIVAAAGNDGGDVSGYAPANCSEVIAVAATTTSGRLATYSNYGSGVALSAPGGSEQLTSSGIGVLTNTGSTGPVQDGLIYAEGTSFAAPMVSGTASLVLAVAPNLTAAQLRSLLTATVSPFFSNSNCTTANCGTGIVNAQAAVQAAQTVSGGANYQGIWWNSPAGSESGWGINFAHQGDTIFASWFTYDTSGRAWWLVMTAAKSGPNTYRGTLYQTRGPAFNAVPWSAAAVTTTPAGTGTLVFSDPNNGTFSYTVGGVTQTKGITRQVFGAVPVCTWGGQPNLALATNYQDLWWAAPGGSESGWGVNLNHQGSTIFATWFTYDVDGSPLWLVATAPATGANTFGGDLYRTTGPAFGTVPFAAASVIAINVGTATFSFTDGNTASFAYTVQLPGMATPATQTKTLTRQVFATPGTACR